MIYQTFETYAFQKRAKAIIAKADEIIKEYQTQGYTLTLRQLYYQFVARGLLENSDRSYKNLGGVVTKGRMAGLLPWDGIEDRNRGRKGWLIEEDIPTILDELPGKFAADFWDDQDYYVELWVEKEALSSVIQRAARPFRLPYMACKGYLSASEAWRAGKRFERAVDNGKQPLILHLGDHDPSGIDMTRDNKERTSLFSWEDVEIRRLALNMDQVEEYNPPPNPAKVTDSRAADYIARYGDTSWELDALEPATIVELVSEAVGPLIDWDLWGEAEDREREGQALLRGVRDNWEDLEQIIRESWTQ